MNTTENIFSKFNLPGNVVYELQRIALADDDMVKSSPDAAFVYRAIVRNILKEALIKPDQEGSEPIKLTENKETENPDLVNEDVRTWTEGYIAGAIAQLERTKQQLKEERNKAIDECVALVGNQSTIDSQRWPEVKRQLQALKQDSK